MLRGEDVPYFSPLSDRGAVAMARRTDDRPHAMARLQQLFIRCHAVAMLYGR